MVSSDKGPKRAINRRYEPETRVPYVNDEWPAYPTLMGWEYKPLRKFAPPAYWGQFNPDDERWDPVLKRRYIPEWRHNPPEDPIDIRVVLNHFCKSIARTNGVNREIGLNGTIQWVEFARTEHCFVVITKWESYKMLTEKEVGITRSGEVL